MPSDAYIQLKFAKEGLWNTVCNRTDWKTIGHIFRQIEGYVIPQLPTREITHAIQWGYPGLMFDYWDQSPIEGL